MNCLTKLFQQKRRRIGYILAFSGPMISKRDSSDAKELFKRVRQFPSRIPAIPLTHPCHSLHAPCNSPHALKGAEAPSPGHRPGYSCPHAWRPVGAKALYGVPNFRLCSSLHPRTGYGVLSHVPKIYHFGISDKRIYICASN